MLVTLVYLAVQMRQSNGIARADAAHKVVNTYSAFRQMLTDEGLSAIWSKARNDEPLSPQETIRLDFIIEELTYSSWAAYVNRRFASNANEIAPAAIAFHLGASATLRNAWARLEAQVRGHGLGTFADEVSRRLDPDFPA